jgi:hypothetical protein
MDMKLEHASIIDKKVTFGPPCTFLTSSFNADNVAIILSFSSLASL